ncbi:hypothetical protein L1049_016427 [Liquidambar formosana]|uniref:Uncharacterized protein n=1 Tax=Liquidambar formosana TaxID=63359 RepID=A0AAP0RZT5_LIQFO
MDAPQTPTTPTHSENSAVGTICANCDIELVVDDVANDIVKRRTNTRSEKKDRLNIAASPSSHENSRQEKFKVAQSDVFSLGCWLLVSPLRLVVLSTGSGV